MVHKLTAMFLAGGTGERLTPFTLVRGKPAVPIAGKYRIMDFAISNFHNSGFFQNYVLVQYKNSSSVISINDVHGVLPTEHGMFVRAIPPSTGSDKGWYIGTADAIYKNLNLIRNDNPDYVAIFGADHVYKMDVSKMLDYHIESGSQLTISVIPLPVEKAKGRFGVIETAPNGRIIGFEEKPQNPKEILGKPGFCFVSMGNYIFNKDALVHVLKDDNREDKMFVSLEDSFDKPDTLRFQQLVRENPDNYDKYTIHDFGHNIIPHMTMNSDHTIYAYDFSENWKDNPNQIEVYWRDVGTLEDYFNTNMMFAHHTPKLNMYDPKWPIRTKNYNAHPAKLVFDAVSMRSLLCEGTILSNAKVLDSVISPFVHCHRGVEVFESILFEGCNIGRNTKLKNVIFDKNVRKMSDAYLEIGFNPELDKERGFYVVDIKTEEGIPKTLTIAPKGAIIQPDGRLTFDEEDEELKKQYFRMLSDKQK